MKLAAALLPVTRRVLGIDPGSNVLGYAILEQKGKHQKLLLVGVHHTRGEDAAGKLYSIFNFLNNLIQETYPTECALEAPFFGKNVQSMLKLGRAQGVAMAVAMANGLPVCEYAPKKIKLSVTGNGNATKEQVAEMTCRLLDFDRSGLKLDATDAVATALCHLNQGSALVGNQSRGSNWKQFLESNPGRLLR